MARNVHGQTSLASTSQSDLAMESSTPVPLGSSSLTARNRSQQESPTWTVLQDDESDSEDEFDASRARKDAILNGPRISYSDRKVQPGLMAASKSALNHERSSSLAERHDRAVETLNGIYDQTPSEDAGSTRRDAAYIKRKRRRQKTILDGVVITVPPPSVKHASQATSKKSGDEFANNLVSALHSAFLQNSVVDSDRDIRVAPLNEQAHSSSQNVSMPVATPANVVDTGRELRHPGTNSAEAATEYWKAVDDLLETENAPSNLPRDHANARSYVSLAQSLRFLTMKSDAAEEKTKFRAYTMPRWSRTAMFKERLDSRLGPGDFNRGLWKRPKELTQRDKKGAEDDRAPSELADSSASATGDAPRRLKSTVFEMAASVADASETSAAEDVRATKRQKIHHQPEPRVTA